MGKQKYLRKVEELFRKSPVVGFKSVERLIGVSGKSNYAKLLISNLLKSGRIKKLGKGCYTMHDETGLSVLCYSPAYLGLQSALSFHGLWEQETIPVIITSRKVRTGIREVAGGNILLRKTKEKFVFGFGYFEDAGFYLPYSDVEKTFIDMIFFRQPLGKNLRKKFAGQIEEKKLRKYLRVYNKRFKDKVLKAYSG